MKRYWLVVLIPFLFACASVPKNSPLLSQKLGEGITALKKQQLSSVDAIRNLSAQKVDADYDKFLDKAKEMFKTKYERAPSSEKDYYTVGAIALKIRDGVLSNIQSDTDGLKKQIDDNYAYLLKINNEITQYLYSAAKLKASEEKTLDLLKNNTGLGVNMDKYLSTLENTLKEKEGGN